MKCEIIDGHLVVQPTTATEKWAFETWIESQSSWGSVRNSVRIAEQPKQPEPAQPQPPEHDAFLDGLLDSAV